MKCKTCKKDKPEDKFYNANGRVGKQTECILCFNVRAKENRKKKRMENYFFDPITGR